MEAEPEAIDTLYVDGHVRVYHGSKTKLPRKYVSRQRLCLRGTTDYWVNDKHGRPFFDIGKVVDSELIAALREDIVPRLLREVPNQPTPEQLREDPFLCRFTLVFDRWWGVAAKSRMGRIPDPSSGFIWKPTGMHSPR